MEVALKSYQLYSNSGLTSFIFRFVHVIIYIKFKSQLCFEFVFLGRKVSDPPLKSIDFLLTDVKHIFALKLKIRKPI